MQKEFLSTMELANILGVSRQTVFKKIKSGQIKATRVGKNFIISRDDLPQILGETLSSETKADIEAVVKRVLDEYGETMKLLARE